MQRTERTIAKKHQGQQNITDALLCRDVVGYVKLALARIDFPPVSTSCGNDIVQLFKR